MAQVPRPDWSELDSKLQTLRESARAAGCDTVLLRRQASLSWLLGARSHVPNTLDATCFDLIVTPDGLRIVVNAIEGPRLEATDLAGLPNAEFRIVDWWADRSAEWPSGAGVAADLPTPGTTDLSSQIAVMRRRLTPGQRDSLAELSRDAAAATTRAAARLSPTMTEYQAAGVLAGELLADGMDPIVLMVAGAARLKRDLHPLPTTNPLGGRAMLVCCGRRYGQVTSVTRMISFDRLTEAEHQRYRALLDVEAEFLDASVPGAILGDVLQRGAAAYARYGFDPDEWHRHHQGGLSGWEPREFPARPTSPDVLAEHMVVAWNPSGDGWKVEDTCLVSPEGAIPLVDDDEWPMIDIHGRRRPDVLQV